MNKLKELISPKFNPKVKSFIISDGESKMLLARQFIQLTIQELHHLHTQFLIHILSTQQDNQEESNSVTVFTKHNNIYQFLPYQSDASCKLYFILITEQNFNIIESRDILKTIYTFISSIVVKDNNINNKPTKQIIHDHAYDIILAVDDIVNPILGSEKLSQAKINEYLQMFSSEEDYFNKQKEEKINKAHDELVKGMEEIEKQKYYKVYRPNAVSNEDVDREQRECEEKQKIMDELEEQRERFRRMINFTQGMSLRRHLPGQMRQNNMQEFLNTCETLVQTMMIRELQRVQTIAQEDDGYDEDDTGNFTSQASLIVTPLHVFYTGNSGPNRNIRINYYTSGEDN